MPSGKFRYYRSNAGGQLQDIEWFNADSDEDAIVRMDVHRFSAKCEIWRGNRLVAELN